MVILWISAFWLSQKLLTGLICRRGRQHWATIKARKADGSPEPIVRSWFRSLFRSIVDQRVGSIKQELGKKWQFGLQVRYFFSKLFSFFLNFAPKFSLPKMITTSNLDVNPELAKQRYKEFKERKIRESHASSVPIPTFPRCV